MPRKAVLIAYPDDFALQEASSLAEAGGYKTISVVTQDFLARAKYGVGAGKAEEVRGLVKSQEADVVVFDERVKPVQAYNLAKLTGVEIVDRERLILEIFRNRAVSAEAKLQVRLAELKYEMARAREKVRLAKKGEQPGFYGLGKYEVDVYYQAVRRQISAHSRKLRQISSRRQLYRYRRERLHTSTVSLAGYTGAGKTTLFNVLADERKEVDRGAFTTLGTSTRGVDLGSSRVLLSDTVGFISNLPTYMIEAFKSTLEELHYANLVILVLDASDPSAHFSRKCWSCLKVLSELSVSVSNILAVLNKADLADVEALQSRSAFLRSIGLLPLVVSAKTTHGLTQLRKRIAELTLKREETISPLPSEVVAKRRELDRHMTGIEARALTEDSGSSDSGTLPNPSDAEKYGGRSDD